MKRKLAAFLCIALAVCVGLTATANLPAQAGWLTSTVLTDDFDNATPFDANFNVVGNEGGTIASVVTGNGLLRMTGGGARGITTQASLNPAGSYIAIEYDLVSSVGGYIYIVKGTSSINDVLDGDVYGYSGTASDNTTNSGSGMWADPAGFLFLDRQVSPETAEWLANSWAAYGLKNNFRYRQQWNDDGSFVSSIKDLSDEDAEWLEVVKAPAGKYSTNLSGRVGIHFNLGEATMEIRNLLITDGEGNTLLSDELTSSISITTAVSSEHTWRALGGNISAQVLGPSAISFKDSPATAQMILKEELDFEDTAKYSVSFKALFKDVTDGRFGVAFGGTSSDTMFAPTTEDPLTILAFRAEEGKLMLGGFLGSAELTEVTAADDVSALADEYVTLRFVPAATDSGYSMTVYLDGRKLHTYEDIDAVGYMAVLMDADEMEVLIDDFAVTRTAIVEFDSEDMEQDFEENMAYSSDIADDWYYRSHPTVPGDAEQGLFIRDGKLVFDNAGDGSYFGYNKQYANWELELELSDINKVRQSDSEDNILRDVSSQLMISFARKMHVVNYITPDSSVLIIDNNPWGGGDEGAGRAYIFEAGIMNDDISYNYPSAWEEDAGTAYVRVVAYNESLYLFVWYDGMDPAYKDIPVNVWRDVDTVGYIALCSTTNASFSVDNFTIKNLDGKPMPQLKTAEAVTKAEAKTVAEIDLKIRKTTSVNLSDMFELSGELQSEIVYTANFGTIEDGVWTYTPTEVAVDDIVVTASYFGNTVECKFAVSTTGYRACDSSALGGAGLVSLFAAAAFVVSARKKRV